MSLFKIINILAARIAIWFNNNKNNDYKEEDDEMRLMPQIGFASDRKKEQNKMFRLD